MGLKPFVDRVVDRGSRHHLVAGAMNKSAKIVFIVAAVLTLVGIIICVAAMATASNSVDVGFDLENVNSGTLKVTAEKGGLGFDVNIAASTSSADCTAQLGATSITDPNSADVSSSCSSHCS